MIKVSKIEAMIIFSVWTIDIAYLLHKFDVKFKMYTTILQADDTYAAKVL